MASQSTSHSKRPRSNISPLRFLPHLPSLTILFPAKTTITRLSAPTSVAHSREFTQSQLPAVIRLKNKAIHKPLSWYPRPDLLIPVYQEAKRVKRSAGAARKWLNQPCARLGGRIPVTMCESTEEAAELRNYMDQYALTCCISAAGNSRVVFFMDPYSPNYVDLIPLSYRYSTLSCTARNMDISCRQRPNAPPQATTRQPAHSAPASSPPSIPHPAQRHFCRSRPSRGLGCKYHCEPRH